MPHWLVVPDYPAGVRVNTFQVPILVRCFALKVVAVESVRNLSFSVSVTVFGFREQ